MVRRPVVWNGTQRIDFYYNVNYLQTEFQRFGQRILVRSQKMERLSYRQYR